MQLNCKEFREAWEIAYVDDVIVIFRKISGEHVVALSGEISGSFVSSFCGNFSQDNLKTTSWENLKKIPEKHRGSFW